MKKTILISGCILIALGAFAQQKKTPAKSTHQSKPSLSPEKQKMLCKPWKLDSVEQFGVYTPATAKQQNDGITFLADSILFLTQDGVPVNGKWMTGTWGTQYINTTLLWTDGKTKIMYKIMKLSDDWLELEHQTPDLIRIHYFYSAKKKQ